MEKRRFLVALAGLGMAVGSFLTIEHYFAANFPATIFEGSFCDINAFFNCDSSAYSVISAIWNVPIGTFGLILGLLVLAAALFRSDDFASTVRFLLLLNIVGVVALLLYSVFVLGSLCLLCSIYYVFSAFGMFVAWPGRSAGREFLPGFRILAFAGVVTLLLAFGMREYHSARVSARSGGDAARVEAQFRALPKLETPSVLAPNWVYRAAERFEEAPLHVVVWEDYLCSDCRYFYDQLKRVGPEFDGRMNLVFQDFPLEAACNTVVEKDKHPGACDLSKMALYSPDQFEVIYTEVFENQEAAKDPVWRQEFARRLNLEAALTDSTTAAQLQALIATGAEYERTSEQFEHGIRSTPTMLINGRLVIGTFPDELLVTMLRSALAEVAGADSIGFIERWND